VIKLLKAIIATHNQILATLEGAENPQLIELRIKTEAQNEILEEILDYLQGFPVLLKCRAEPTKGD
jgi:hypothetical protein